MKSFNIITKVLQVRLKKNNTTAIRRTLCYAVILLGIAVLLIGCPDSTGNGNGNSDAPGAMMDTTAPDAVTNVTATPLPSGTEVLLRWTDSSSDDVTTITISWSSTVAGIKGGSTTAEVNTEESTIGNLVPITPYTFVITVPDAADNSTATTATPAPVNTLSDLIDADGNGLIDINSLERLHNMRYNLDVGAAGDDGRYKESGQIADEQGILCGANADTPCTGYELVRSLDFTDVASYDGSIDNAMRAWRPNSMANSMGNILPQALADNGTNRGWDPIGNDTSAAIRFNSRFEGNGHTIHNLYGRRSAAGQLGIFGAIGTNSVIRSIGVATVRLYGDASTIGALVGVSRGAIVASYASGAINGGMDTNNIGGLVGTLETNTAAVVASYAAVSVNDNGGLQNRLGGLIGNSTEESPSITASYASGNISGGSGINFVGGLAGQGTSTSTITASYASGNISGGNDLDFVGGLAGQGNSAATIVASYATGTADGGEGTDTAGALLISLTAIASYGFGAIMNAETKNMIGAPPEGVTSASGLTLANAGAQWNQVMITASPATTVTTMDALGLRYCYPSPRPKVCRLRRSSRYHLRMRRHRPYPCGYHPRHSSHSQWPHDHHLRHNAPTRASALARTMPMPGARGLSR